MATTISSTNPLMCITSISSEGDDDDFDEREDGNRSSDPSSSTSDLGVEV